MHAVCLICDCYVSYIFQSSKYDWLMIDLIMKIQLKNDFENIYMRAFISRTENMVVLKFYCQENMTFFNLAIFLNTKFKCMQNIREVRYSKTLYCNNNINIIIIFL